MKPRFTHARVCTLRAIYRERIPARYHYAIDTALVDTHRDPAAILVRASETRKPPSSRNIRGYETENALLSHYFLMLNVLARVWKFCFDNVAHFFY